MPYFNREFPVLGGGNSGERMPPSMEEKDHAQYGPRPVMRNTREYLTVFCMSNALVDRRKEHTSWSAQFCIKCTL